MSICEYKQKIPIQKELLITKMEFSSTAQALHGLNDDEFKVTAVPINSVRSQRLYATASKWKAKHMW